MSQIISTALQPSRMLRQGGRQSVERLGALLGRRSSLAVLHGVEACALVSVAKRGGSPPRWCPTGAHRSPSAGRCVSTTGNCVLLYGTIECDLLPHQLQDRGISNRAASWPAAFGSWSAARRQFSNSSRRCRSSSASSSGDASDAAAQQAPSTAHITDLPAKVHLLERFSGYTPDSVVRRYTPFMCSPIHHIATRLEFLHSRGKLRRPPRLWEVRVGCSGVCQCATASGSACGPACCPLSLLPAGLPAFAALPPPCTPPPTTTSLPSPLQVICPSDEELCSMHNETLEDLAAFKQQFLASQQWHEFCRQRGVTQPQPEAAAGAAGEQAPA